MFNPPDPQVRHLLKESRTIAVVGLSPKPARDSHRVSLYMQQQGYTILPVNPVMDEVLGQPAYDSLDQIEQPVDIVNVFRRSQFVPPIARQAVQMGARALWLQEGVFHKEAAAQAEQAGLLVMQDSCIMVEHRRLLGPDGR